jgi:hypothetical protein
MTQRPISPAEAARTRKAWVASNGRPSIAAQMLGIPPTTMSNRVRILGLDPVAEAEPAPLREVQRQRDETSALRKQVKALSQELNRVDDLRATVFKLAAQDTTPPTWISSKPRKGRDSQIPVLVLSDFHLGEYINPADLDGINGFDVAIARARYRTMIEKTISLSRDHMGTTQPDYPGIVYLRNGDLINGMIHDNYETNDLKALAAVKELVSLERWGLARLKAFFGRVWCISTPGNHGRDSEKPHGKDSVARSFDIQAAEMLELIYEDDPAVAFWNPSSGDAVFSLKGTRLGVTHGDRIGTAGGRGFLGSVGPIMRGAKNFRAYYAALDLPLDVVIMGHYHDMCELPGRVFANGCVCGYGQYARGFRFTPRPAAQWLLFFGDRGITARWAIQLSGRPSLSGRPPIDFKQEN